MAASPTTAPHTPGLFTIEAEESHLDELVTKWHTLGLSVNAYSRMLRLAKKAARRHGVPLAHILATPTPA